MISPGYATSMQCPMIRGRQTGDLREVVALLFDTIKMNRKDREVIDTSAELLTKASSQSSLNGSSISGTSSPNLNERYYLT